MNLEYVCIRVICRVNQAEYAIRILLACATGIREYLYSTRRGPTFLVRAAAKCGNSGAVNPFVCKMANNLFFLSLFWPNLFSHLAAFSYNGHWIPPR